MIIKRKKSVLKKISIIWFIIFLITFILLISGLLEKTKGFVYNFVSFLVVIVFFGIIILAKLVYCEEWKGCKFKCSKCGFIFKSPLSLPVLGCFYFLIDAILKSRFFLRCPNCKKFSWCQKIEQDKNY